MNPFAIDLQLRTNTRRFLAALAGAWLLAGSFTSSTIAASGYRVVAVSGQHAPGTPDTVVFGGLSQVPSLNEAGDADYASQLSGLGSDATNYYGLWAERAGILTKVIRAGDPAPGTLSSFSTNLPALGAVFNDAGQIAFFSSLTTSGPISDHGIFSGDIGNLHLVVHEHDQAPGFAVGDTFVLSSGTTLASNLPTLNNLGHVAFTAQLTGSDINSTNDEGIWTDMSGQLAPAILEHSQVPGLSSGVLFDGAFGNVVFNDADQIGFYGRIAGTGITSANKFGIWLRDPSGAVAAVARAGDQAPGTVSGTVFSDFATNPDLNGAGQMAILAKLSGTNVVSTNAGGIWKGVAGNLHLVARNGDPAPGAGNTFSGVGAPIINSTGHVAFSGSLSPPAGCTGRCIGGSGIWSDVSGAVQLVALSGNRAPDTPDGVTFLGFDGGGGIGFNAGGQVAFRGSLTGTGVSLSNEYGIWASDLSGVLHLIARAGDAIEVGPGDVRTIRDLALVGGSGNGDGRASGFNDRGQLAFLIYFTDASYGAYVSNLVASVPEPASALLIAIGVAGFGGRRVRRDRAA